MGSRIIVIALIACLFATSLVGCGEKAPAGEESVTNAINDAKKEGVNQEGGTIEVPGAPAQERGSVPGGDAPSSPKGGK